MTGRGEHFTSLLVVVVLKQNEKIRVRILLKAKHFFTFIVVVVFVVVVFFLTTTSALNFFFVVGASDDVIDDVTTNFDFGNFARVDVVADVVTEMEDFGPEVEAEVEEAIVGGDLGQGSMDRDGLIQSNSRYMRSVLII